ncbi:MAG TPA: tape measure protein, partial [Bryobacteraceae bacterium]|nr:tape measure protein [Bryobacteraceae bacterium]
MTLQELLVKLGLDASAFESGLNDSQSHLEKWADKIDDFGSAAMGAGATLTAGFTLPLVGLGAAALSVAGDMEQNRIAFTQMLGSAEAAGQFLEELREFAAKTPFEFPELVQAARNMKAMGFEAAAVIPMMTVIGDAAAAMGGGAAMVDRITTALGQMQAKTKVAAQEMIQLTETGIPAWKMLADGIGVSIPQAMKMAEKGAIDAGTAINAILAGMQSEFGGMMEQQSRTLQGQWSNLKDQLTAVLETIGAALIPFATTAIQAAAPILDVIKGMAEGFGTLPGPVQTIIVAVAGLAAAIGPVLVAVGAMAAGISSIISLAATLG